MCMFCKSRKSCGNPVRLAGLSAFNKQTINPLLSVWYTCKGPSLSPSYSNQSTQEVKTSFLNVDKTKQWGNFWHTLPLSNKATDGQTYKTGKRLNTYLNVTVEDRSWSASFLAKIDPIRSSRGFDLGEGGSISTAIFNSDSEINLFPVLYLSVRLSLC